MGAHAPAHRRREPGSKVAICDLKERPRTAPQVPALRVHRAGAWPCSLRCSGALAPSRSIIQIIRAFVRMRELLISNRELAKTRSARGAAREKAGLPR